MTTVNDFLRENVDTSDQTKEVKFGRFKSPFVIKALGADENSNLQKQATKKNFNKKTRQWVSEVNQDKYVDLMIEASVVTPDLNNAELQKNWDSIADPSGLLKKMLLAGEYGELATQIQEISGFDAEDINYQRDEVKN